MRLEDICTVFTDGDWIESKDQSDSGIRLVQTGNIGEGTYLEKEARAKYISEETFDKLKCTEVFTGDILVSRLPEPVGRACIVPEKTERMITAVDCTICRPNESLISKEYLCYFMRSNAYYMRLLGNVTGTTRKRISRKNLGNVELRVPIKDEQKAVVEQLDCLVKVIDSRTKELQLLDDLIKARFVELFGDLKPTTTIARYISELRGGKSLAGTEECKNKVLKTGAATFGWFDPEQYKYLPTDYEPLPEHKVETGDVIISRMNTPELVGACSYVFEAPEDMYYPDRLWKVIPQAETNPIFLWQLLWDREIRRQIKEKSGGTSGTMHNISKLKLLEIKCIDAPIELQEQFADFVKQVDKSKLHDTKTQLYLQDYLKEMMIIRHCLSH